MSSINYLGMSDLVARWCYTPQGARKVAKWKGFPAPAFSINGGKTSVWLSADIEVFEAKHSELRNAAAKRHKQIGFFLSKMKGTARDEHAEQS